MGCSKRSFVRGDSLFDVVQSKYFPSRPHNEAFFQPVRVADQQACSPATLCAQHPESLNAATNCHPFREIKANIMCETLQWTRDRSRDSPD
jgi:hypothetical protein